MNALVLGLARSGQAAALALAGRGEHVIAVDRSLDVETGRLEAAGVEVHLGSDGTSLLEGVEAVIKSPGVPNEAPLVAAARDRGIPIWSEVELGARLLPNPLLGVTGTNGKTTTAELLGAMLDVPVAGNVGRALTELVGGVPPDRWVVCELSSFQLEDIHELRPRVAILLNLEPDHLDRHGTFEAYRDAKLRIFENQTREDTAVVPRGFPDVGAARRVEFSGEDGLPAEPRIPGVHNRENAAAATAAARAARVSDERIAEALREFPGVPHRLEEVGEVGGVRYVNDSKATNAAAARRAIASYDGPLHVILGGLGKNESYEQLAADLRARGARAYLIGAAAGELAAAMEGPYELNGDLASAVRAATAAAKRGEIVLLSPACASYDQFENFEQRGDEFRRLVEALR
jgi:UDP-N-acetylmuramoylalanine--D-glutamate ligase